MSYVAVDLILKSAMVVEYFKFVRLLVVLYLFQVDFCA